MVGLRCDEGEGHGSCHAKLCFVCIHRCLVILASIDGIHFNNDIQESVTTKSSPIKLIQNPQQLSFNKIDYIPTEHDTVRGTRFCLDDTLAVGPTNLLANASKSVHHSIKISLEVGHSSTHNTTSNALQDILVLELSRGTISEWQIKSRSRMTAVHNRSKTTSCREGLDQDIVHDIVNNNTRPCVVDRVDGIVVSIILVAVEIDCLATVSAEMQEERVVRSCIPDEPLHSGEDVGLCGFPCRICLIVRQCHRILFAEPKSADERLDVANIIDTTIMKKQRID